MIGSNVESFRVSAKRPPAFPYAATPVPGELENRVLRRAVQENLVTFPSQVPALGRRSRHDVQQRIVVLYFVCGWTMDNIARRYGLGRQRMGQILTEWRIRAVKEGYIQEIEPEHPIFQRVRLEQTGQQADVPAPAPAVPASEVDAPLATPGLTEFRGSHLAEQLHAIVGILDNQLRICSNPRKGTSPPANICSPAPSCSARVWRLMNVVLPKGGQHRLSLRLSDFSSAFKCTQSYPAGEPRPVVDRPLQDKFVAPT